MVCCVPSKCIQTLIVLSTAVTVVVCMGSALVLILAPEEPWPNLFNGGDYTRIPALVLLLAALLSVLIGFLGCCGLLMDSRGTLIVFSVCAMVVGFMEVAGGGTVFTFAYTGEIKGDMEGQLHSDLCTFTVNGSSSTYRVNKLQSEYHCCGIHGYTDWLSNTTWSQQDAKEQQLAPQSCCKPQYQHSANCTKTSDSLHSQGCVDVLMDRLKPVVDAVLAVTIIAAALQVLTGSLACYGARIISRYQHYDIL